MWKLSRQTTVKTRTAYVNMIRPGCLETVWTVTVMLLKYGASILNTAWIHNHIDHTKKKKVHCIYIHTMLCEVK